MTIGRKCRQEKATQIAKNPIVTAEGMNEGEQVQQKKFESEYLPAVVTSPSRPLLTAFLLFLRVISSEHWFFTSGRSARKKAE
jgi:hypothetical protein